MRDSWYAFLVSGLMLAAAAPARADDGAAARALVDRAVQAHGGGAKLAKLPAVTGKLKGTFHGLGVAAAFTGEFAAQGPDRQKFVIEAEVGDEKFRLVHVLNRDKGWVKINDDTEELDKEDLAEAKEEAYGEWVATLVPLKGKAFRLAPLGEVNFDKRPALGVRVSSKGHRDVNLYFDKKTGLLVKTETRVKDDNDQEVTEETFLSNYKEVQGTQQATKLTVKRDGKLYLESEVTDYQLAEKLDDGVFAKP
jgi:hypothetical protein